MNSEISVKSMVAEIEAGNPQAEDRFCRQFRPLVQFVLRQMTDDLSLADDITKDALLLVLLRIRDKKIEHPERISSYVAQTARYSLIGWFRRKANQHGSTLDVSELESSEVGLEDALIAGEQRSLVRNMISQLKVPRDQEILARRYLLEEDKLSLCEHLGLPDEHFDRVISRARARCKKIIKAQKPETLLAMQIV